MGFWQKLTGFFNRKERREQEKEVKAQERKWWQFWKRKPTEPEPGEAMPEEEEAPWRVDSASLMKGWEEKRKREQEEAEQKRADEEKKRQQYEKARDTANRRYGTNWTQEEYDQMWDWYGNNPDIAEYFPSDDIIYAAEFAKQNQISFNRFSEIVKEAAQEAAGRGLNRQEASQILWNKLDLEVSKKQAYDAGVFEEEFYEDLY